MIVGIDYSLTSPALCALYTDRYEDWNNCCHVWYLTDKIKLIGNFMYNIIGDSHIPYKSDVQRYENIAKWALNTINALPGSDMIHIYIEDYSLGSKGRVFNIAENTGILKYKLYQAGLRYTCLPPTVVKKQFTGKGNANKEAMFQEFIKRFPTMDIPAALDLKYVKLGNPTTDIVDAYAIAYTGLMKEMYHV